MNEKKMNKIIETIKKYPDKYYNIDFWRVTLNINLKQHWSMSNKSVAKIFNALRKKGIIERIGTKQKYLYRVIKK